MRSLLAIIPAAALFLALAGQACAQVSETVADVAAGQEFTCTDGFTLKKDGEFYSLRGTLETPTPGYMTELVDSGAGGYTLKLAPGKNEASASLMVVGTTDVSATIRVANLTQLDVTLEKDFNWGPGAISCHAGG